jgi:anti-sigma factor RsiW
VPRKDGPPEEELAALADGSLPASRAGELEARVAQSPELAEQLAEQHRALSLIRGAAAEVEAPPGLRARVGSERSRRNASRRSRSFALAGGIAAAAAVAVVLALTLPSGAGGPALADAAAVAMLPATLPAPAASAATPKLLDVAVEDVPFPSWLQTFGWRATGARIDTVGGREATTVFYEKDGRRIGYTIVAGEPLDVPAGSDRSSREGVELHAFALDGRDVVTWKRGGLTCILSGDLVPRAKLLDLAAWKGKGAVPF